VDPPLRSRKQTPEYRMETSNIDKKKYFQNSAIGGKSEVGTLSDTQGPILGHFQVRGTTINSVRYSEMLRDQLKPTIRTKRRGPSSKGFVTVDGVLD
jgi:hypothetical protein